MTNQAFAAAGLIDELSIVLAPAADGDSGSASLFETGGFSTAAPTAYSLKAVEQIENDTLWLRYTAKIGDCKSANLFAFSGGVSLRVADATRKKAPPRHLGELARLSADPTPRKL